MHALIHFNGSYSDQERHRLEEAVEYFEQHRPNTTRQTYIGKPWVINCQSMRARKVYIAHRYGTVFTITARSIPELIDQIQSWQ